MDKGKRQKDSDKDQYCFQFSFSKQKKDYRISPIVHFMCFDQKILFRGLGFGSSGRDSSRSLFNRAFFIALSSRLGVGCIG